MQNRKECIWKVCVFRWSTHFYPCFAGLWLNWTLATLTECVGNMMTWRLEQDTISLSCVGHMFESGLRHSPVCFQHRCYVTQYCNATLIVLTCREIHRGSSPTVFAFWSFPPKVRKWMHVMSYRRSRD